MRGVSHWASALAVAVCSAPMVTIVTHGAAAAHAGVTGGRLEAAFPRESYAPGPTAQLRLFSATHLVTIQLFRSGPEPVPTRARDTMNGVAGDRRRRVGARPAGRGCSPP